MLRAADRALYAAKDGGRNRVHLASSASPLPAGSQVPAGLARIADVVDSRICGDPHSKPMAVWAGVVADRLGLDPPARRVAVVACRLHDIGKMAVPDRILSKPDSLNNQEWEIIRAHSNEGARMLAEFPGLDGVAEAVKAHHERYDGAGDPTDWRAWTSRWRPGSSRSVTPGQRCSRPAPTVWRSPARSPVTSWNAAREPSLTLALLTPSSSSRPPGSLETCASARARCTCRRPGTRSGLLRGRWPESKAPAAPVHGAGMLVAGSPAPTPRSPGAVSS
jgi:putative nucleotidyltransferase with HDIG domain